MKGKMFLLLITLGCINYSCAQKNKKVNIEESKITWEGSVLFGFGSHDGTIDFKEANIITDQGELISGEFIIDMHSMKSNEEGDWVNSLIDHLKNEDFFDVKNYATSKFKTTNIEQFEDGSLRITGDLTIKGITNSIYYYATYYEDKTQLSGQFKIDRQLWGITYNSKGMGNLKNNVISDAISFKVSLKL